MPPCEFSEVKNAPVAASKERTNARARERATRLKICDSKHACDILAATSDLPSSVLVVVFSACADESQLMSRRASVALCVFWDPVFFSHRPELADKRKRVSGRVGSRPRRVLAVTVLFLTPAHACCPVGYQCGRSGFLRCSASLWRLAAEMRSGAQRIALLLHVSTFTCVKPTVFVLSLAGDDSLVTAIRVFWS